MRKLLSLAARVYRSEWRQRYGAEFDLLLDDVNQGWAEVWDVLQGGMKMQAKRSRVAVIAAAFGIVGALAASVIAFAEPDRFQSTSNIRFEHPAIQAENARLEMRVPELFHGAFSRANLARIVERQGLFKQERASGQLRLDEAAERMRYGISILKIRDTNSIVQIAFSHPDPGTAQRVAQDLVNQLSEAQASRVQVIDPPDLPRLPAGPNRVTMAGAGFGEGALFGAIVGLLFRRRRG